MNDKRSKKNKKPSKNRTTPILKLDNEVEIPAKTTYKKMWSALKLMTLVLIK